MSDATPDYTHVPVMVEEIMAILDPAGGGPYWDLTVGAGGHLATWIDRSPSPRAYGLDGDPAALQRAGHLDATLVHADLGDLARVAREHAWPAPRAVLMDLGLSSPQVDDPDRGFSYRHDGPLDMRMDPTTGPTASEWLDQVSQDDLARTLRELGEERFSGRIARVIKESLPITTTGDLAAAVLKAVGSRPGRRHHPARRTFQAVRMAVNRELEKIERGLTAALDALAPGGRVVVLSYHSGEDRVVKHTLRDRARGPERTITLLNKKPRGCSEAEAAANPRARSALLRAAEKLSGSSSASR